MPTVTQKPPAKPALSGKAQDAWTNIEGRVEDVRRRHRMKFATTGLLLGLAVFAAAFLGFSLVDVLFKLSVGSRLFWLALALGGTVAVVIWSVVRPWRMLGGSTRVAREVETAYPELEDQLSTALEYGRDGGLAQATSSPELVGALLEQAQRRAKPLDFRRTVNWRAVSWALLVAFVVAAVVATYGASNPRLFGATVRRFLMPTASIPAPTLTVIEQLTPGGGEYPVETSVPVTAKLSGRLPESATLLVKFGIDPEAPWEHRLMERGEDGDYHVTLRRLLDDATFQVKAGDALSEPVTLKVYQEPQVDEFSLRLEHPAYTGKAPEVLPAGMGEVRALKGTRVTVRLLANTELGRADLAFDGGRKLVDVELQGRGAELTFEVAGDDRYQLLIEDTRGRVNRSPVSYRIQATEDQRPRVRIKKPARDMMVHREQAVEIEIEASDDVGLREIGIFHSLGVKEEKKMVRRFEPCPPQAMGRLKWELGNLGLKGGEVLAYYAYALDNDTLNGPKLAKSDIHFLTVYDEEEYDAPQDPQNQNQPTPESVRQLDKLIEIQKKLLQETFAMARLRNEAGEDPKARQEDAEAAAKRAEREKKDAERAAQSQSDLKTKVEELIQQVTQEMEAAAQAEKPEGDEPAPPQPQLGEKELGHMKDAAEKMETAAGELKGNRPEPAVPPEMEALRHLSETRRLLLSDKEGDPRFKMAMNDQSRKRKKKQQTQQQQDQQEAREEMSQLPPMLEREKDLEREIERLEKMQQEQPPKELGAPQTAEEKQKQNEQRQLQRKNQDALDQLRKDVEERAEKMRELARRNPELQQTAEQLDEAAKKLDEAQKKLDQNKTQEAKHEAQESGRKLDQARKSGRDAMEKDLRREMANLQRDAQELGQRQEQLAQQSKDLQQKQEQQGQPQQGQPQQGQPQQGQPQQGQPQQGQPQQGQAGAEQLKQEANHLSKKQGEVGQDMKDLGERMAEAERRARQQGLAGAEAMEQARQQAEPGAPGREAADKAQQALKQGQAEKAEHDQRKAARALEAMARAMQEALNKTAAEDMAKLNEALKQAQELAQKQGQVHADLGEKRDPLKLAEQEEQIADAAENLAGAADKLEALKAQGRNTQAKNQLEEAAKAAREAARNMAGQDTEGAKKPSEQAEKALQRAAAEMERASGKTLEDRAREAKDLAAQAREQQEKAAGTAKELPEPKPGEKLAGADAEKRDEAAERQQQAAKLTQRLEKAIEGLEQIAKEINPNAAQVAREAKEFTKEEKLPQKTEDLAKGLERIGDPKKAAATPDKPAPTPGEAAKQGEQLAEKLQQLETKIEQFRAEANGDQLERLQALEKEAKSAAETAKQMARDPNDPAQADQPGTQPGQPKDPREAQNPKPGDAKTQAEQLEKDLKNLEPKLERLEANAPEKGQLQEAQRALERFRQENAKPGGTPQETKENKGGEHLKRLEKALDGVSSGLHHRVERLLKARDIRAEADEVAPKEYGSLVEQYYKALSADTETEK